MITENDFLERVILNSFDKCPFISPETTRWKFSVGAEDCGPWCFIANHETVAHSECNKPCPHAHTPHIHVYEGFGKSIYEYRAWIVPRVVTGYLEEYGDETTVTCLDCILESLRTIDECQ